VHRTGRGAWWFSSDGSGRFDPVGTGQGACYLAERPLGAWVEVFRREMVIAEQAVRARSLVRVALGRDLPLADLTSRRALRFGVTASLGAGEDYEDSQRFARRALESGFAGVCCLVRHDPAQRLYGVALFGPAGAPDSADSAWPVGADGPIPDDLLDEAGRAFGYRILPTP
jgi:RES domain